MAEYDVVDLLKFAHENKPNDFQSAFQGVMQDKISAALDAKKEVIAQQMMNGAEEEEEIDIEIDDEVLDDEPEVDSAEEEQETES
jgi:hypothetical protein